MMSSFHPNVNDQLTIDGIVYGIAEHPAAPGMPHGQEGRQAIVYALIPWTGRQALPSTKGEGGRKWMKSKAALKVFKPRFRLPFLVSQAEKLVAFADLPGMQAARRIVLTPQRNKKLLRRYPELIYAVLMPWIDGPTWGEVLLGQNPLAPRQSLALARSLADVLSVLEQHGVAHCDLSGANVMLPALGGGEGVELVDLESFFAPGMLRPQALSSGSAGYAHRQARGGLWSPEADRFAGAVLLAEMLGWCDSQVVEASWGESYFDPQEMQEGGDRYRVLVESLRQRWGDKVAGLFDQAWHSDTLGECPTFGEWLVILPEDVPVVVSPHPEVIEGPGVRSDSTEDTLRVLMDLGRRFEEQGKLDSALDAYRQAQAMAPVGSGLTKELASIIQKLEVRQQKVAEGAELDRLFDDGLAAYQRGKWPEAKELLGEVVRRNPDYEWEEGKAARDLLAEVEKRLAPSRRRVPRWAWVLGGVVLLAAIVVRTGSVALRTMIFRGESQPVVESASTQRPAATVAEVGGTNTPRPTATSMLVPIEGTNTPRPTATPTLTPTVPMIPVSEGPWRTFSGANDIQDMFLDGNTLWCATSGGLVQWNVANGTAHRITVDDGLPANDLYAVYVDSAGTLWVGSASAGLIKLDNDGRWVTVAGTKELGSEAVQDIVEDTKGNLWVGTDGGGASRFDGSTWTRYTPDNSTVDRNVYVIYVDEDGSLWFGAGERKCFPCSGDLAHYDGHKWEKFGRKDGIPGWKGRKESDVWDIIRVPGDGLWVATPGGIGRYANGQWKTLSNSLTNALLLSGDTVWAAEGGVGIGRYDAATGVRQDIDRNDEIAKGTRDLILSPNGSIWAGGWDGLIQRTSAGEWHDYVLDSPLPGWPVDMAQSSNGILWVASRKIIQGYDGHSGRMLTSKDLGIGYLNTIFAASDGVVWVGGRQGVAWYSNGKWRSRWHKYNIEKAVEDSSGGVWFNTLYGGAILKYFSGQWKTYSYEQGDLPGDYINDLSLSPSGHIWVALNKGAIRIPPDGKKSDWQIFSSANGLSSDDVLTVLEDRQGRYWFSTSGSIDVRLPDGSWRSFGHTPGVEWVRHLVEDSQGNIWAGGSGLSKYQGGSWSDVLPKGTGIRDLLTGYDGSEWAATYGDGVYHIGDNGIVHYRAKPYGLASNYTSCVFEDAAHAIWICTFGGLSHFIPGR